MTVLDQEERKLQADQSVGRQESPCSVGQIREKESKKAQNLSGRLVSSERRDLMRNTGEQSQCEDCEISVSSQGQQSQNLRTSIVMRVSTTCHRIEEPCQSAF